jgi:hypothetical protein
VPFRLHIFQHKPAAFRHRITGINRQIQQNLLNLPSIGFDPVEGRSKKSSQFNIFSNQALEHFLEFINNHIEVKHFQFQHLLTAEGQNLPGKAGGSQGRCFNLH